MAPTPHERLRAFEDEKLGPDAPRHHHGKVENGHGSLFARLPAQDKHTHSLLQELIEADAAVTLARASLAGAEERYAEVEAKLSGPAAEEPQPEAKPERLTRKQRARAREEQEPVIDPGASADEMQGFGRENGE